MDFYAVLCKVLWILLLGIAALEGKEPSVSTVLMNFGSSLDPYEAVCPPLYQTATFKQVLYGWEYVVLFFYWFLNLGFACLIHLCWCCFDCSV